MKDIEFDRRINQWLRGGPSSASPRVLQAVVEHVSTRRPDGGLRSHWHTLVEAVAVYRPRPVVLQPIVLIALLALSFGLGAFVYASWQQNRVVTPLPSPMPSPTPSSSAPGTFRCPTGTDPSRPGPSGQVRPPEHLARQVAIDANSGVLVLPSGTSFWLFDLCTNTWRQSAATVAQGTEGGTVYDADSDLTVVFAVNAVIIYDADSDTARRVEGVPLLDQRAIAVYDPDSGLIVVRDASTRMWTYDVDTNAWLPISQSGDVPSTGGAQLIAYDTALHRIVMYEMAPYGATPTTYEFDPLTSVWMREDVSTPGITFPFGDLTSGSEIAYDAANARTIVFSDGEVIAYDATVHQWETVVDVGALGIDRLNRVGIGLAYDPINERVVVVGGNQRGEIALLRPNDVLAFDLRTRTWTDLLAPQQAVVIIPPEPCPPGSPVNEPGPADQARPALPATGWHADVDLRGLLVLVSDEEIWRFSLCSNSWRKSAVAIAGGGWPVYDWDSELTVIFGKDFVTAYDAAADSATRMSSMPLPTNGDQGPDYSPWAAVYDPVTGLILVRHAESARMWTYDVSTDEWNEIDQAGDIHTPADRSQAGAQLFAYDPAVDRVVLYAEDITFGVAVGQYTSQFDPRTSTWTEDPLGNLTPHVDQPGYELTRFDIAYDYAGARAVVYNNGAVFAYDATARAWQKVLDNAAVRLAQVDVAMASDQLNGRIVAVGANPLGSLSATPDDVSALDLSSGSWMELLAPSGP